MQKLKKYHLIFFPFTEVRLFNSMSRALSTCTGLPSSYTLTHVWLQLRYISVTTLTYDIVAQTTEVWGENIFDNILMKKYVPPCCDCHFNSNDCFNFHQRLYYSMQNHWHASCRPTVNKFFKIKFWPPTLVLSER